jgi:quinoprotein dehydrogenase-associated probable ABC transporter substrate-binding protein
MIMTRRFLVAVLVGGLGASSAQAVSTNTADLVNRKVLRVCAAPGNMPFSNKKQTGFENKIAAIVAEELGVPVENFWYPQGMGLVRQTLNRKRCDLVVGTAQTDEFTLNTNHYYRTAYSLVYRSDDKSLEGLKSVFDPRLKGKKVGVQAGAPPGDYVAKAGLMTTAKPYVGMPDRRYHPVEKQMLEDLIKGDIDVATLWGPFAGYYAKESGADLVVQPMVEDEHKHKASKLTFRITMGVRPGETNWKRRLNDIIKKRQDDINDVLLDFGVPLLDEKDAQIKKAGP